MSISREETKKLKPIIDHFAGGGDLWWWYYEDETWYQQTAVITGDVGYPCNIIEDQHFDVRKTEALGGAVECRDEGEEKWYDKSPLDDFTFFYDYRVKPKEPVFEWQYIRVNCDKTISVSKHMVKAENDQWIKYKPSKREVGEDDDKKS